MAKRGVTLGVATRREVTLRGWALHVRGLEWRGVALRGMEKRSGVRRREVEKKRKKER